MNHRGFVVPPRSTAAIYNLAAGVRKCFSDIITAKGFLQIDVVYELLPEFLSGFELHILEKHELGNDHGRTYPDKLQIHLRKDVYDQACQGHGRDRFTLAHELGHLFLHRGIAFARAMDGSTKIYQNSEWQANTFASALLIDEGHLRQCRSLDDVVDRFGVSLDAARVRFK